MDNRNKTDNNLSAPTASAHTENPVALADSEQARRNAIGKIGRYSAYIAPVMLAMFHKEVQAGS